MKRYLMAFSIFSITSYLSSTPIEQAASVLNNAIVSHSYNGYNNAIGEINRILGNSIGNKNFVLMILQGSAEKEKTIEPDQLSQLNQNIESAMKLGATAAQISLIDTAKDTFIAPVRNVSTECAQENEILIAELETVETELNDLKTSTGSIQLSLVQEISKNESLQSELDSKKSELKQAELDLAFETQEKELAESSLANEIQTLEEVEATLKSTQENLAALTQSKEQAETRQQELQGEVNDLQIQVADCTTRGASDTDGNTSIIKKLQSEKTELEKELKTCKTEKQACTQALTTAEQKITNFTTEKETLNQNIETYKTDIDMLCDNIKELNKQTTKLLKVRKQDKATFDALKK